MFYPMQEDINILHQHDKKISISFELLNKNMQVIDILNGEVISGDMNIDSSSDIKRTLNVVFYLKNKSYHVEETSKIWIDKMIRIKLGLTNIINKNILWYTLGLFIFTDYGFQYDSVTNAISVSCVDFMANFTSLRNGKLTGEQTLIPAGSNIRDVIISTITQLGGIKNYIVNEDKDISKQTIPYDLEFQTGVTVYDILVKIRDLYPAKTFFFDIDGTFIYQDIPSNKSDMIMLDNTILNDLIISENTSGTFNNVKNVIQIFGLDGINAIIKLVSKIPDIEEENTFYVVNPDSPYTIEKIGEILDVKSGGEYENIYDIDLIRQRGEYEIWLANNKQISLSLTSILIPFLDTYQKIEYKLKSTDEINQYITNKISFDLTSGTCTIDLNRFYSLYPFEVI